MGQERSFLKAGLKQRKEGKPVRPIEHSHVILGCRKELEQDRKSEGLSQNGKEEEEQEEVEKSGEGEGEEDKEEASQRCKEGQEVQSQEEIQCQLCGEEEGEQAREAVKARTPTKVSTEEREKHELTHTPFRSWCKFCVMGRGKNQGHRKVDRENGEEEMAIPRMSMDYFFLSEEDEKASKNPMIVMVDERTGEKYARVVSNKGVTGSEMNWLVIDMSKELKSWGYAGGPDGHIVVKSDNEISIKNVVDALARHHGGRVVPELSAKGESQSNGRAEEAGKTTRGFARVMKFQLEEKAGIEIEEVTPVLL